MTTTLYMQYPDLFQLSSRVTHHGEDAKGVFLVLDQSLFYSQGGGQPADQGEVRTENAVYKVFDVRNVDGQIRHYISDSSPVIYPGQEVTLFIDQDRRMLHSKYHTAGHLVAAVVEQMPYGLKAIKGHQFPDQAYVEYDGMVDHPDDFGRQVQSGIQGALDTNAVVQTYDMPVQDQDTFSAQWPDTVDTGKPLRVCRIEGFAPVPCRGTHVKRLDEISSLVLTKCKSKKGKTKVHYTI